MTMVALNAERSKVVPVGSLEARWMVNEGDASDYIKAAKKHPKMQALMREQEAARLEDEKKSARILAAETARRGASA